MNRKSTRPEDYLTAMREVGAPCTVLELSCKMERSTAATRIMLNKLRKSGLVGRRLLPGKHYIRWYLK